MNPRSWARRIPRWLLVTVAAIAGGGLVSFSILGSSLKGGPWLVTVVLLAGLFGTTAIVLPQLQQYQADDAKRFQIRVVPRDPTTIAEFDIGDYVANLTAAERRKCLESLKEDEMPARRPTLGRSFDASKLPDDPDDPLRGVTVGQIRRLLERRDKGDSLSRDELRILEAHREATSEFFSSTVLSTVRSVQNAFSSPDNRTPDEYRQEVDEYCARYREVLESHLLHEYIDRGLGALEISIINPTDRPFTGVQVTVHIGGPISSIDMSKTPPRPDAVPTRPRAFGERKPHVGFGGIYPSYYLDRGIKRRPGLPGPRPRIENSGSTTITYPEFDLRPHSTVPLDIVHLLSKSEQTFVATWTATSIDATGKDEGSFTIGIERGRLHPDVLLADFLR